MASGELRRIVADESAEVSFDPSQNSKSSGIEAPKLASMTGRRVSATPPVVSMRGSFDGACFMRVDWAAETISSLLFVWSFPRRLRRFGTPPGTVHH